jgi:hypothetical protein
MGQSCEVHCKRGRQEWTRTLRHHHEIEMRNWKRAWYWHVLCLGLHYELSQCTKLIVLAWHACDA